MAADDERDLPLQNVVLAVLFVTLIVITVVGNVLIIAAVLTTQRLRTVTNYFVLSLAMADFLVGIFVMPLAVLKHLNGHWPLGDTMCTIFISSDVCLCTASILSLCAISIDRYLAITNPLHSRRIRSKRLTALMIICVWCIAVIITVPPLFLSRGYFGAIDKPSSAVNTTISIAEALVANENDTSSSLPSESVSTLVLEGVSGTVQEGVTVTFPEVVSTPLPPEEGICDYADDTAYVIFSAMTSFFVPLTVMVYVYFKIGQVVAGRYKDLWPDCTIPRMRTSRNNTTARPITEESDHGHSSAESENAENHISVRRSVRGRASCRITSREHKTAQTLSIVVGGFIICWLPFFVAYLVRPILDHAISDGTMIVLTWLGWINSAINPFIYAFHSPDFRLAFWRLTLRHCTPRQQQPPFPLRTLSSKGRNGAARPS